MDIQIKELEKQEFNKRDKELCLIASEGFPSEHVLDAQSSIFSLKYAEGRADKRYYCGCEIFDKMEKMCEQELLKLFNAPEDYNALVQPHSGTQANMIVYGAILKPNDVILAPDVKDGFSHISHSHPLSFIGKYHNVITYGSKNGFINYEEIEELALKHNPKLIIIGFSAYSRTIDYKRVKNIADKVKAYTLADIAHISLLVATGIHPSPLNCGFDFVSSTTHKMLNGSRGGILMYKKEFGKDITRGLIPFVQGGPLGNMILGKLACFKEMNSKKGLELAKKIIKNANTMSQVFIQNNIDIVSGGTDNHLMIIDLTKDFAVSGKQLSLIFEDCGLILNCNSLPNDKRSFMETSGLRIGVQFITRRGLNPEECSELAQYMSDIILLYKDGKTPNDEILQKHKNKLRVYVEDCCKKYPLRDFYPKMYNELFEAKEL